MNTTLRSKILRRSLLVGLALAAWLPMHGTARAYSMNVTQESKVISYVPGNAAVGETILVNHSLAYGDVPALAALEFNSADGRGRRAPVTRISNKLFRVTVPFGALSGVTAIIDANGARRVQDKTVNIVPLSLRQKGISLINSSQYVVNSVTRGGVQLLPADSLIPIGEARFFSHNFADQPDVDLTVNYVHVPHRFAAVTQADGSAVPVSVTGEIVGVSLPRPDMNLAPLSLSVKLRREFVLERLSGLDLLGVTDRPSIWTVHMGDRDRAMEIKPDGTVVLKEEILGVMRSKDYDSAIFEGIDSLTLRLIDRSAPSPSIQDQVNKRIKIHLPFDNFATDTLGFFDRKEDDSGSMRFDETGRLTTLNYPAPPIMVRRVK